MAIFASNIITSDSALGSAVIEKSLRIDQGASDLTGSNYSRTFGSGERKVFTISLWVKKCGTPGNIGDGDDQYSMISAGGGGSGAPQGNFFFYNDDTLRFQSNPQPSTVLKLITNRKFRDLNSWYHLMAVLDTTQATASNRAKIYVNGVQETSFSTSTYPSQNNTTVYFNGAFQHRVGSNSLGSNIANSYGNFNGYLAEFNFIDGTALTPSSFGFTDPQTGIWMPKRFEKSSIPNKKGTTFSGSGWTVSGGSGFSGSKPITNAYNGSIGTSNSDVANNSAGGAYLTWDTSAYNLTGNLRIFCWSDGGEYDIYVNGNSGSTTKVGDTPSGSGNAAWIDCGTFDHIKEIQFSGTTYNTDTGLGSSGVYIAGFMVNGTLLRDDMPEHGTNGFYLDFSDNTNTTTLGIDKSPNGNDFTPEDVATNDSVKDTPTNAFATLNANVYADSKFKEGNLYFDAADTHKTAYSNIAVNSGKWYWEAKAIAGSLTKWTYGVSDVKNITTGQISGQNALLAHDTNSGSTYKQGDAVSIYIDDIRKNGSVTGSDVQDDIAQGNIVAIALDVDAGKVWFGRNGTWINGSATASTTLNPASHDTTVTTGETYVPAFSGESADWQVNFGQDDSFSGTSTSQGNQDENGLGSFYYAVPSGFKALCTKNLLAPNLPSIAKPQKHFECVTYTGDGSNNRKITGLEFTPDMIWIKSRSNGDAHVVQDIIRTNGLLYINQNSTEGDTGGGWISSFNEAVRPSDGFTINSNGPINTNSQTYVAWCWKAGGAAVANTDGTINTQVSANQTAGFSIVTYTGTGSAATIGHGLGKAPRVVITKLRDTTTQDWFFLTGEIMNDRGKYQKFNESGSIASDTNVYPATATTSTVYSVGTDNSVNGSGSKYVSYCWTDIPGYSKFGKYKGNFDANGVFINLGFTPALIIVKKNTDDNWPMYDYKRDPTNPGDHRIFADVNTVEGGTGQEHFDFLSNGIKWRRAKNPFNNSDAPFFYMAFARRPGVTPFGTFPEAR